MTDENEGETFVDVCSVDDENAWKGNKKISPIPTSPVEIGSGKVDLDLGASSTANDRGTGHKNTNDADEEAESEEKISLGSRKEKSLGKLCGRFLLTMGQAVQGGNDIHLETLARAMCEQFGRVEKRRIYDIVNVMEALEAMSKTNKSFYRWHGLAHLPQLMYSLREEALSSLLPERVKRVEQAMCSFVELPQSVPQQQQQQQQQTSLSHTKRSDLVGTFVPNESATTSHPMNFAGEHQQLNQIRDRNGKNSLAQLCRRFLMVLLCNPRENRRVSLDVASTVLIKDPDEEGFEPPSRSKCRRLYDIANVLVALNLISKVHYLFGTKKIPLFVYCGPEPDSNQASGQFKMLNFINNDRFSELDERWKLLLNLAIIGNVHPSLIHPANLLQQYPFPISSLSLLANWPKSPYIGPMGSNPLAERNLKEARCSSTKASNRTQNIENVESNKENVEPHLHIKRLKTECTERDGSNERLAKPRPLIASVQQTSVSLSEQNTSSYSNNLPMVNLRLPGTFVPSLLYHSPPQLGLIEWMQENSASFSSSCSENKAENSSAKVSHSVSSILGNSQKENTVQPGFPVASLSSPKAFKPVKSRTFLRHQTSSTHKHTQ